MISPSDITLKLMLEDQKESVCQKAISGPDPHDFLLIIHPFQDRSLILLPIFLHDANSEPYIKDILALLIRSHVNYYTRVSFQWDFRLST